MRFSLIFILTLSLASCSISFEKDFYEKVSGIKFPKGYKVLETFDNGEWLTGTVFKIDSLTLRKFVVENQFKVLQDLQEIHLVSNKYLIKYKANFTSFNNIYFISKSLNKNNWIYVADLNECKLWTEISYPDWGGK